MTNLSNVEQIGNRLRQTDTEQTQQTHTRTHVHTPHNSLTHIQHTQKSFTQLTAVKLSYRRT